MASGSTIDGWQEEEVGRRQVLATGGEDRAERTKQEKDSKHTGESRERQDSEQQPI